MPSNIQRLFHSVRIERWFRASPIPSTKGFGRCNHGHSRENHFDRSTRVSLKESVHLQKARRHRLLRPRQRSTLQYPIAHLLPDARNKLEATWAGCPCASPPNPAPPVRDQDFG